MSATLATNDLRVEYGAVTALDAVTIEVPSGASLAVIGPNGCGKSTLLKALAGIVSATSGGVTVADGSPALVLQSTDVDPALPITVRDTVALARYPALGLLGRWRSDDRRIVDEALAGLELADLAHRHLHELSGGQRQRVLVAQGLAQGSAVLLLDEPLTGIDVRSRALILDALDRKRHAGRTIVTSTHNFEDARRCDLVLLLATRPVAFGTPDEVLVEAHLHDAFGGRFVRVGDTLLLDDPHHDHDHAH